MAGDLASAASAAHAPSIAQIVEQAYRHYLSRIGRPPGPMHDDYTARVLQVSRG
jgi:hypothetical protein